MNLMVFIAFLIPAVIARQACALDKKWFKQATLPYKGATIRGISEHTPASVYIRDVLAPVFSKITGIDVEVEIVNWGDMYDRSIQDIIQKKGVFDFIYVDQDIIHSYLDGGYLGNLTALLKQHKKLHSPGFSFEEFTSFLNYFKNKKGDVFGMPFEAFLKLYMYRKDLFSDKRYQNQFKEKYGYSLKPAETFDQYRDIAEFFTQVGKSEKKELWGTSLQGGVEFSANFYEFIESIAPAFGVYNWGISNRSATSLASAALNGKMAKEALTFWSGLKHFAPPEHSHSTWDTVAESMGLGRVAQGWIYGENIVWLAQDSKKSRVAGKIEVSLPPVSKKALADAKAGKGYLGYYDGGAFGIPVTSRHQELSLIWLQFIGDPGIQVDWALKTGRIVHKKTFDSHVLKKLNQRTGNYFSVFQQYEKLFAGAPSFPDHANIRDIVAVFISKALEGSMTPSVALDAAAKKVNEYFHNKKGSPL